MGHFLRWVNLLAFQFETEWDPTTLVLIHVHICMSSNYSPMPMQRAERASARRGRCGMRDAYGERRTRSWTVEAEAIQRDLVNTIITVGCCPFLPRLYPYDRRGFRPVTMRDQTGKQLEMFHPLFVGV